MRLLHKVYIIQQRFVAYQVIQDPHALSSFHLILF